VLVTLASAGAQRPPRLPLIDRNACPFECCQFGPWTARSSVDVYDRWERKGRTKSFGIHQGEKVMALTGIHVTYKPGHVRVLRAIDDLGLRAGDVVETYMYLGEGAINYWNGKRMREIEMGQACSKHQERNPTCQVDRGETEWWIKVRTKSGRIGWVQGNKGFDGTDACG
jgi:hypothetical protein